MRLKILFLSLIFFLGIFYLLPASPSLPDLANSGRSDEEGDTWQNPDQKGFYSNLTRAQVLKDIQTKTTLNIFGFNIPSYRLNYPPEEAGTLVRDQLKSNYLEEIVYPLRDSVYVNGWEPDNAPQNTHLTPEQIPDISLHDVVYAAKITLRPVYSHIWQRLLIWTLIFPASYLVYLSLLKSFKLHD